MITIEDFKSIHQTIYKLKKETINYLNQSKKYLEQISQREYIQPIAQMNNTTIGKHTRHFLECYQCLLNHFESGEICYDERERNLKLETNPKFALKTLENIIAKIPQSDTDQSLIIKTSLPSEASIKTSFNRELLHNYEHTTHHLALIRVGLNLIDAQVEVDENFGVANATIQHQSSSGCQPESV